MATSIAVRIRDTARGLSAASAAGTVRSYFPLWDAQYRPFLRLAVEALPVDRFDFKPRPAMLTAQQLLVHIAESERGWIHHVLEGGPYEEWVVPHADPQQGWVTVPEARDHAALLELLDVEHRRTQAWLDKPAFEIDRVITYRAQSGAEKKATLHWILACTQEHEIHHRAQLALYLRMMGVEPPPTM
ncbi:MAG: DinB family protein [Candidatus Eiseniibacteriota bacterium]